MQLHFPPIYYINVLDFEIHNVSTKMYLIAYARPVVPLVLGMHLGFIRCSCIRLGDLGKNQMMNV
jgi:hypothetical protein